MDRRRVASTDYRCFASAKILINMVLERALLLVVCVCLVVASRPALAAPDVSLEPPAWLPKASREQQLKRNGQTPGPDFTQVLSKSIARIRMRDGIELHTE